MATTCEAWRNWPNRPNRQNQPSERARSVCASTPRPGRPIGVSPQIESGDHGHDDVVAGKQMAARPSERHLAGGCPDATVFMRRPLAAGERDFPQRVWGSGALGQRRILADFVSYVRRPHEPGDPAAWNAVLTDPADSFRTVGAGTNFPGFANAAAMLRAELDELVDLIPYRASVQAEMMAQKDSILQYFSRHPQLQPAHAPCHGVPVRGGAANRQLPGDVLQEHIQPGEALALRA